MRFMRNKAKNRSPGVYCICIYIYMYTQYTALHIEQSIWGYFTLVNWICTQYLWRISYTWKLFVFHFAAWTLQNKVLSNKDKTRVIWIPGIFTFPPCTTSNLHPKHAISPFAIPSLAAPRFGASAGIMKEDLRKSTSGMVRGLSFIFLLAKTWSQVIASGRRHYSASHFGKTIFRFLFWKNHSLSFMVGKNLKYSALWWGVDPKRCLPGLTERLATQLDQHLTLNSPMKVQSSHRSHPPFVGAWAWQFVSSLMRFHLPHSNSWQDQNKKELSNYHFRPNIQAGIWILPMSSSYKSKNVRISEASSNHRNFRVKQFCRLTIVNQWKLKNAVYAQSFPLYPGRFVSSHADVWPKTRRLVAPGATRRCLALPHPSWVGPQTQNFIQEMGLSPVQISWCTH